MKTKLLVIGGPTASGKSAAAIRCALRLGGEIISADSMQLYRGMDIGTAKPDAHERALAAHHLIDVLDPASAGADLADYTAMCADAIADIAGRGAVPILCGGTGLYIDTLISGTVLSDSASSPELRAELSRFAEENGAKVLHDRLASIDPASAAATHANNVRRVIRAIEIYETTGITKTEWDRRSAAAEPPYDARVFVLTFEDRELLRRRIDSRVDLMMKRGLEEEVRALYDAGKLVGDSVASQAIGYKEFLPYFRGEITLGEAVEEIKNATRRYAKRQMTWFRRNKNAVEIRADEDGRLRGSDDIADEICERFADGDAH